VVYRAAGREPGTPCPRCGPAAAPLAGRKVGTLRPRECPGCWGVWLDAGDVRAAGQTRALAEALIGFGKPGPAGEQNPLLDCPICGKRMRRRVFAKGAGFRVDECKPHGTWFDVDELRRGFSQKLARDDARAAKLAGKPAKPKPPRQTPTLEHLRVVPSGENSLRQAVRLLWKAVFGHLL
jgi:Zn-finger nucleic acid-binding protein